MQGMAKREEGQERTETGVQATSRTMENVTESARETDEEEDAWGKTDALKVPECYDEKGSCERAKENHRIEQSFLNEEATTEDLSSPPCGSRPADPYENASLISKLFFMWPYHLMQLGMKRSVEDNDIPSISQSDTSHVNLSKMDRLWRSEIDRVKKRQSKRNGRGQKSNERPNLHRAIMVDYFRSLWYIQPLMCAATVSKVVQSIALGLLIETFDATRSTSQSGYLWAGVLVLTAGVVLFEHHHVFVMTWKKGMQLRIACVAFIYDKSLRLQSTGGVGTPPSGQIMNLASNDVERFLLAALFVSYLFWAPAQSFAILAVGMNLIGPAAFGAGFGVLVLIFMPLQLFLSQRFGSLRSKIATITDARVTLVSQAIAGARVMKMSGWEGQFEERISRIRAAEIRQIQKANRLKALNEAVFFSTNVTISTVVFMVHVANGGELTPRIIFTTISLINVLQIEMTKHVSLAVMAASECYVSISRIQKFFEVPELSPSVEKHSRNAMSTAQCNEEHERTAFLLSDVTCFWYTNGKVTESSDEDVVTPGLDSVALEGINLEFKMNQLTCIIGCVGSGKSALLQALTGELPVSSGHIKRYCPTLSYASQDPWIMDGTVRENITMGLSFDEDWYNECINACGLTQDFQQFRDADATIVGDRGVQCSGGQRARIGLARALYRNADILVLDDPLSAVDSKVGRLIFYSAIQGLGVKKGKCVVLATHQHQFIRDSRCVLMSKGKIQHIGSYSDCVAESGGTLALASHNAADGSAASVKSENHVDNDDPKLDEALIVEKKDHFETNETLSEDRPEDQKEVSQTGIVRLDTFLNYARAMGGVWVGFLIFILFCVTQASVLICVAFFGKWAEQPVKEQSSASSVGLILGLNACMIVLAAVRAFSTFALTIKASRKLHDKMTRSVLRAKIEFFDTNPIGRILNRFSADVGSNDDLLPPTLFDFLMAAFVVLGAVITSISVLPFTLVVVPPLLWYFLRVRRIFVTTTRELKRIEGVARSPIFAMLSESLSGIATMRSNDATHYFKDKFERAHDAHTRAFYAFISSSRWLGFRMDGIMFLFLSLSSFLAVLFNDRDWFNVDPSVLGLALSMLLQLAGLFQWSIRQSAEVVNQMVSVERALEFGDLLPEAALVTDKDAKFKNWPKEGSIEVEGLVVRYRSSLPPSLKNVSFKVQSGQRIGVVGRTGSGKSTLIQALFRILEAEQGSVLVDGVDIASLGLHKIRGGMSVIPQFPVLFSGCSIRENLDPFHSYTDKEIRDALSDVQMTDVVDELPSGLNSVVAEGGSNFSVGQRQLICLARAILRKNKILVLDEPTANVDSRTDELLQQSVNKSFRGSTIISVAHRLDTVIESDQILVLGQGEVLEYGAPHDLVSREGGHFASMVHDTGAHMSTELKERALKAKQYDATN